MALTPKLANVGANAAANAVTVLLNSGYLDLFDGTQPTDADTAIGAQVKLAHIPLSAAAFGTAVAGVATANAIVSNSAAVATGTATWFRAYRSNGTTAVFDGSVGTSGCNVNLSTVALTVGDLIAVSAFSYTQAKT